MAVDDATVNGVVYRWSQADLAYTAAGWDENDQREELIIMGEVNGFDVTAIYPRAFIDNRVLTAVTIGEGITDIGQNAFDRCENLRLVKLPDGLKTIGEEAFAFCTALTVMAIPASVTNIASHAFWQCTGVTDAYFFMETAQQLNDFNWWDGVYPAGDEDDHGGKEFNTVNHTVIHVPAGTRSIYVASGKLEAWLGNLTEDNNAYPLWWIVNFGTTGHTYTIADDLTAVRADVNGHLRVKDAERWLLPDVVRDGEVNYMAGTGLLKDRGNRYDQSNWAALSGLDNAGSYCGHTIPGGTVTGTLVDKLNPVIAVSSTPQAGPAATYEPNVYIAASLMGRTQQGNDGKTYAFVRPKPQEVARVDWAIYGGNNEFYVPAPYFDGAVNIKALKGGFTISDALYESPPMATLEEGGFYAFDAVFRLKSAGNTTPAPTRRVQSFTPYVDGGLSTTHDVLPLAFIDMPEPTGINDIDADGDDEASTTYYDLAGHASDRPHKGVNIVVTRRGDRSTTTKTLIIK